MTDLDLSLLMGILEKISHNFFNERWIRYLFGELFILLIPIETLQLSPWVAYAFISLKSELMICSFFFANNMILYIFVVEKIVIIST